MIIFCLKITDQMFFLLNKSHLSFRIRSSWDVDGIVPKHVVVRWCRKKPVPWNNPVFDLCKKRAKKVHHDQTMCKSERKPVRVVRVRENGAYLRPWPSKKSSRSSTVRPAFAKFANLKEKMFSRAFRIGSSNREQSAFFGWDVSHYSCECAPYYEIIYRTVSKLIDVFR
jgi:hypothetical protein